MDFLSFYSFYFMYSPISFEHKKDKNGSLQESKQY